MPVNRDVDPVITGERDEARFFCSTCQKFWKRDDLVECGTCDPPDGCPDCGECCRELWSGKPSDHIVDRTEMVERRRKRTGGDA